MKCPCDAPVTAQKFRDPLKSTTLDTCTTPSVPGSNPGAPNYNPSVKIGWVWRSADVVGSRAGAADFGMSDSAHRQVHGCRRQTSLEIQLKNPRLRPFGTPQGQNYRFEMIPTQDSNSDIEVCSCESQILLGPCDQVLPVGCRPPGRSVGVQG